MITLEAIRDEIAPMVLEAEATTNKVTFKVSIDHALDGLVIAGRNHEKNRELGFAITRRAIDDGIYLAQLKASLPRLVMMLEFDSEDPDTYFPKDSPWRTH